MKPLIAALAACAFFGAAQASDQHHAVVTPGSIKWGPAPASLPPGAQAAVLLGNPAKEGPFVLRLKFPAGFVIPPHRTLAEIEKMAIVQTLQRTNWNKQEAAQILGLYRPTLYSKMKKHDIQDGGKNARRAAASA